MRGAGIWGSWSFRTVPEDLVEEGSVFKAALWDSGFQQSAHAAAPSAHTRERNRAAFLGHSVPRVLGPPRADIRAPRHALPTPSAENSRLVSLTWTWLTWQNVPSEVTQASSESLEGCT